MCHHLSLALYDLFSLVANMLIFTGPNLSETYRHQVTKDWSKSYLI
jgi:Mn2+/Fe2+ NRAMP family transporter